MSELDRSQGDRTMAMLSAISTVVVVIFGLFVWRYEATSGGTGGIVKLLNDRLAAVPSWVGQA
jgi:hypothetical protein